MTDKIRVSILDDHQSIVDGYRFRLGNSTRVNIVSAMSYGEELQPTLVKIPMDVLILDISVQASESNPNPYPILYEIPSLLQQFPNFKNGP